MSHAGRKVVSKKPGALQEVLAVLCAAACKAPRRGCGIVNALRFNFSFSRGFE